MKFKDDNPVECALCGNMVYAPECVYVWNDKSYCCEDCVKEAMYDVNSIDIDIVWLKTAEEKEAEYGDMKYDEMRGKERE